MALFSIISCQNDKYAVASEAATVKHQTIERAQLDSERSGKRRLFIKISYPYIEKGAQALQDSVRKFAVDFMSFAGSENPIMPHPDSAFKYFVNAFRMAYVVDSASTDWEIEIKDFVWYNTPKVLSVRMDAYSNTGGAHPNTRAAIGNFIPANGRSIELKSLVKDEKGLLTLLESKYRALKAEAFANGMSFSPESPFKLPNHFAFTNEGILFHYNTYEIAAYAVGDADITIPYADLKPFMDLKGLVD